MEFWATFITVGLGSGFAVALTKIAFDWFRDWRDRKEKQKYLALRIAVLFEGFSIECARRVSSHQLNAEHDGQAGKAIGEVPSPGSLPDSNSYDLISPDLLDAVFDLPQRCQMAQEHAYFYWDVVGDGDACSEALEESTIEVGALALTIARRLRTTYGIHSRNLMFRRWSIDQFFAEQAEKFEKRRAELAAAQARTNAMIWKDS